MNLIEIYIQEVIRRLPEKSRVDIGLELRSTIEDMLPDDYTEEDVKAAIQKLGNPIMLASRYRDQPMYLIGPRYYDVYVSLLKMFLPISVVISLITIITEHFIGYNEDVAVINVVLILISEGIWRIIVVSFQVFSWLTIIFAILERTDKVKDIKPLSTSFNKWTPDDLKNIHYIPKKKNITKFEVFVSLMWTAIWVTCYFNANHLVGVYEKVGYGIKFVTPSFNQEVLLSYWPVILVVAGLEIALALYKLIKGQWEKKIVIFNTVIQLFETIVFIIIISNPNLIQQEFLTYMTNIFPMTAEEIKVTGDGWIIFIFVVFAVLNIIEGFRKSRIREMI